MAALNLIVDIGNTRTKLGVFSGDRLVKKGILEKGWQFNDLDHFLNGRKIKWVAISTVAKPDTRLFQQIRQTYQLLLLDSRTPIPISNAYRSPKTLGRDRLAVAVAAYYLFPEENCLIIDAGTCITYDFIDAQGVYQGGSIAPGIRLRLRAMHEFTASLPLVPQKAEKQSIGKDTVTSIRTGAQVGAQLEMKGFIEQYEALFGEIRVLLTGGDANYFANRLKTKIFVNQNLVLIGLNKILNYNVQLLE